MRIFTRIGILFIWVGGFFILLYFISPNTTESYLELLFIGFLFVLFGTILFRRFRPKKTESGRFRVLKRKKIEEKDSENSKNDDKDWNHF